ncbi:hypothetical protein SPSYN_01825 [Sporotomaculum syntrophicum]|uniref:Carboxypeptidase regulatory-like domain-containing protein n=1 Tax=Sporotomaculum syntrophicum TaxID=182264 RepID=A0A9D2WRP2_9FIRM|nr:hypothetical protein [Sporotomaculum syntrophicum]KAF1085681.1 hypothetical protein SPSYN_01825 [Sporotomaculum syntrophicum]
MKYKKEIIISIIILIIFSCIFYIFNRPATINGLITWQYNDLIGTKPDVGATVFLMPDKIDKKLSDDEADSYFLGIESPKGYYYAKTDGNGNYDIQDVAPGKYNVIIVSNSAKRNIIDDDNDYIRDKLSNYISENMIDYFDTSNLYVWKYETKDIEVKPGSNLTVSHDFENTYY